jgi:PhzF family phenazine biosynthesis protein
VKYYIVDAFAEALFKGNQAGICLLEHDQWLPDYLLQTIAAENNLAETAYLIRREGNYNLRWFTPDMEVDLCGHATLASAYVVMNFIEPEIQQVSFETISGTLSVTRNRDLFTLDFPARLPVPTAIHPLMEKAIGCKILEAHINRDVFVLVDSPERVRDLEIDMNALNAIPNLYGFVIMAKGNDADFVSRYFTPNSSNAPEDPVCGSSHCVLTPFWADRLGKNKLVAHQLSKRGGTLYCNLSGNRVEISGKAQLYLKGEIFVE